MNAQQPQTKTAAQLAAEKKAEEFAKDPSKYAKRSCNACNGRGVIGHRVSRTTVIDGKPFSKEVRTPVICQCAQRRFARSLDEG